MEDIKRAYKTKANLMVKRIMLSLILLLFALLILVSISEQSIGDLRTFFIISIIVLLLTYIVAKTFFNTVYSQEAEVKIYNRILQNVLSPYTLVEIELKKDSNHQYKDFLITLDKIVKFFAKLTPDKEYVIIILSFPLYEEAKKYEKIRLDDFSKYYVLKDDETEL